MGYKFATQTVKLGTRDGMSYIVHANTPWDADDPLVRQNPGFFTDEPLAVGHTVPNEADNAKFEEMTGRPALRVEQATSAPGEVRKARSTA